MSTATPRTGAPAFGDSASESENPHARSSISVPRMTSASGHAVAECTVADTVVEALAELGVEHAFGIIGGAIAPFCKAVSRSKIRLIHARHVIQIIRYRACSLRCRALASNIHIVSCYPAERNTKHTVGDVALKTMRKRDVRTRHDQRISAYRL